MKRSVYIVFMLLLVAGCGQRTEKKYEARPFPSVSLPSVYSDDYEAAVGFLAAHYWDGFMDTSKIFPCDSSLCNGVLKDEVEQAFANYAALLGMAEFQEAVSAVSRLFDKAVAFERRDTASNVFESVTSYMDKYLYNPNSPYRNEDLYLPYIKKLSVYEGLAPEMRSAYAYDVRMCSLNSTGTPAADFMFCDAQGMTYSLYGIEAEYTLLFFSNPGCDACKNIIDVLGNEIGIDSLISSGKLAVVNVYIDEDTEEWFAYMPVYPANWYNGYDPDGIIRMDNIYNVRAIPSLYLLDKNKTVLMKDAPEKNVFAFLDNLAQYP